MTPRESGATGTRPEGPSEMQFLTPAGRGGVHVIGEGWLTAILELWAQAALSVKRAHDRGRSGWFVLVLFIPLVQIWPLIELWFLRGTTGDNQYGPDPLPGSIPKSQIAPGREV